MLILVVMYKSLFSYRCNKLRKKDHGKVNEVLVLILLLAVCPWVTLYPSMGPSFLLYEFQEVGLVYKSGPFQV